MKTGFLKKTGSMVLSTAIILSSSLCGANKASASAAEPAAYNYATALRDSIIFYDANKCGKDAGVDNFFDWRDACHTEDGKDMGYDLTGGYHDCVDHVKFGITEGYAASVLEWSYYRYKDTFDKTGNTQKMLQQLKHFTDYFLKCHTDASTFYYQLGDGTVDHSYWGSPSDQTNDRPTMFKADASHPAADVVGEASAALSLMYLNYKSVDADYAAQCLKAAKELYAMGKANPGLSNAQGFYSSSTYKDDMAWAGTWLYTITKDQTYLTDAANYVINPSNGLPLSDKWTMCWDDMHLPAEIMLYELTGDKMYKDALADNINYWENGCKTTPGGLKYLTGWGVLRYSAAESMIAVIYYEDTGDTSAKDLAVSQINYILGNNPNKISYLIGYGSKWPLHPHHRAANGYTYIDNGNLKPAKHLLLGGLIGGPDSDDSFQDAGSQYQFTETGIDYAAGMLGACAGLSNIFVTEPVKDSVMAETSVDFDVAKSADIAIPVTFNGNTLDSVVNDGAELVKGTDYTVSDSSVTISKAYLAQQGVGDTKLTFLFSGGKIPSVTFNVSDSSGGPVAASNLEIQEYNDSQTASSNQIAPRIRIINKGKKAIALSSVKVRYYYTADGTQPQNFFCDWSTVGSSNVTGTFNLLTNPTEIADSYLEIGFTDAAGSLTQGSYIDVSARFSKADWSNFTQTNDYSFNADSTGFVDWSKTTGYAGNALAWGSEP